MLTLKECLLNESEQIRMYHGSPFCCIKSFNDVKPPVYVTPNKALAKMYAKHKVLSSQRRPAFNVEDRPVIYTLDVTIENDFDLRRNSDRQTYIDLRAERIKLNNPDDLYDFPKIDRGGFIMSSGLPGYGFVRSLLDLLTWGNKKVDAIWIEETSPNIALAIFNPKDKISIVSVEDV